MGQIKRPTAPTIELNEGAITIIPIPLTLGQITATTTIRTMLTPTMVREPHSNTILDYVF